MSTIYLERDNKLRYRLEADGSTVPDNSVTRAKFALPGIASPGGAVEVFDTDDPGGEATLTDSSTVLQIDAGERNLNTGTYTAYITVYDSASPDGLAWASVPVTIKEWLPDE